MTTLGSVVDVQASGVARVVSVVTPTFNSERFLDATIASVVHQEAPQDCSLTIHYHIQDGGSEDRTLEIANSWQSWLAKRSCHTGVAVNMTIATSRDQGMYDAINKGFAAASFESSQLMTWINSDDLLASGAIATALRITQSNNDVAWLGGRTTLIDERGSVVSIAEPRCYARSSFRAGQFDGRDGPFLMQEGVFWRPTLWRAVGGLDSGFRVAGDWDLWRRFAEHSSYTAVNAIFGYHRRRKGQLSENLNFYYLEVDRVKSSLVAFDFPDRVDDRIFEYDFCVGEWMSKKLKRKKKTKIFRQFLSDIKRRRLVRRRKN